MQFPSACPEIPVSNLNAALAYCGRSAGFQSVLFADFRSVEDAKLAVDEVRAVACMAAGASASACASTSARRRWPLGAVVRSKAKASGNSNGRGAMRGNYA